MRKIFIMLLCATLLFSLCACKQNQSNIQVPVNFYYCRDEIAYNTSDAVIAAEIHEGIGFGADPDKMLRSYLEGPDSNSLVSVISAETELVSVQIVDDTAYVTFSDDFSQLSGVKLTTACSCVTLTLNAFSGVNSVHVSAETELLDNKEEIIINTSDIILLDDEGKE